jgi:hypothetical protein
MDKVIKEARAQELELIQLEMTAENNKLNQLATMLGLKNDAARETREAKRFEFEYEKDIREMISKTKAGETFTIGGQTFTGTLEPEPFWNDDRVFEVMKSMPIGDTMDVTDHKGDKLTIYGIAQDDPDTQIFHSVNQNNGNETYTTIDKKTGAILNQTVSKGTGARFKYESGGGSGSLTKEQEAFFKEIDQSVDNLRQGATWSQEFNKLYLRYSTSGLNPQQLATDSITREKIASGELTPRDVEMDQKLVLTLDELMDKDVWAKPGAYQDFKSSTSKKTVISTSYNDDGTKTIIYSDGSRETI